MSATEWGACLTVDPGVARLIPVQSRSFVEVDHEILPTPYNCWLGGNKQNKCFWFCLWGFVNFATVGASVSWNSFLVNETVHLSTQNIDAKSHRQENIYNFMLKNILLYPPKTLFVVGYTVFTLSVRVCVRPSVTFCFFNILKSHCWIFIKPCKHVHICKTNTLDKKVRARGQFY